MRFGGQICHSMTPRPTCQRLWGRGSLEIIDEVAASDLRSSGQA